MSLKPGISLTLLVAVWFVCAALPAAAQTRASADVVVVVDTSTSMREPGMDFERTSLLVSKLLADVVPGDLAVVRLLDVRQDSALIPHRETGEFMPCSEDPNRRCQRVEPSTNWIAEARRRALGVLVRPSRGDAAYKAALDGHLEQRINNSMFNLAFSAAQGIFAGHQTTPRPRTVVWLSDGRSDGEDSVKQLVGELTREGVAVEAVVFGRGDLRLPTEAGLSPTRVTTPAELMRVFAGAFRRMVQAPYQLDNEVSTNPSFQMRSHIDEAWVVVYGDQTLTNAWLEGPAGRLEADYAQDRHPPAGAYRVSYLVQPPGGTWTVRVSGGGSGVAYAVVQRSGIAPTFIGPSTAPVGVEVPIVAEIRASNGQPLRGADVPPDLRLHAEVDGTSIQMFDDGTHGDVTPGDGQFAGLTTFSAPGDVKVTVRARNDVVDRTAEGKVNVSGFFEYFGGPIEIDLGILRHHSESCRPLSIQARQQGTLPFEMRLLREMPGSHRLEVRSSRGMAQVGGTLPVSPGDALSVCLVTMAAASSEATGDPWLELGPARGRQSSIVVRLRWQVVGMTFWERWGWLILLLLALLILAFIIYGFIKPWRFTRTLALVFAPERSDLDEQTPQPLKQWKGVGIRWYRDAKAYLHLNFRVSRQPRGAVASLRAVSGGARVHPENGHVIYRENVDGEWEPIPPEGRTIRPGEPHRIGDHGPFFATSVRRA